MRLDQELVKRGLCESRTEAQELIEKGSVMVNGFICLKQTKQVTDSDLIEVSSRRQFVSRGGEKLQGVFYDFFGDEEKIKNFCKDKIVLDIGSSTGGFCDYLLSSGVSHIDAVDVGTNQLHNKIRNNEKVSVFENTDIRAFNSDKNYNVIVADLSFISLESIFDDIVRFAKNDTKCFLLIKPQFEVGKGNTKKGIVKDFSLVTEVMDKYIKIAYEKGMKNVRIIPCSITGGDGNQEYFLCGDF